jgi:hypothetical protein
MANESMTLIPSASVNAEELGTQTVYERRSETICQSEDVSTADQMGIVERSGTLEFWEDPAEDVYDPDDGG